MVSSAPSSLRSMLILSIICHSSEATTTTHSISSFTIDTHTSHPVIQHLTSTVSSPTLCFMPSVCHNQSQIILNCSKLEKVCDVHRPCRNDGICFNTNTTSRGFKCSCLAGFDGDNCEIDIRPCKPHTCGNDGVCKETSDTTFNCSCQPGWIGVRCERKRNYCEGVKCLNNGVCRPLLLNFTCECWETRYSGRYCEILLQQHIIIRKTVSKSLGYIAILSIASIAGSIVFMDILKYVFKIDPFKNELKKIRSAKILKTVRRRRVPRRPTHLHKTLPTIAEEPASTIMTETNL